MNPTEFVLPQLVWHNQRILLRYGYLSEYESFGQNENQAGDYAEDIAAQMLASSLGHSI